MLKRIFHLLRGHPSLTNVFLGTTLAAFVILFGLSVTQTMLSPRGYRATVHFSFKAFASTNCAVPLPFSAPVFIRTECEVLKSDLVLSSVLAKLQSAQHQMPELRAAKRFARLRSQIMVRPASEHGDIEIHATADNAREAALVAETVMKVYREERLPKLLGHQQQHAFNADLRDETLTPSVKPRDRWVSLGRSAIGSLLLGVAAAVAIAWRLLGRRALPAPAGILAPVFVVLFCLATGASALVSSFNIAVGSAAGMWLGLMGGAIAHWTVFLRNLYPSLQRRRIFTLGYWGGFWGVMWGGFCAVAMLSFVIVSPVFAPVGYSSTVLLEVSPIRAPGKTNAPVVEPFIADQRFLSQQCERIMSKENLRRVSADLNLSSAWHEQVGVLLTGDELVKILRSRLDVAPVLGTRLFRLRAVDPDPRLSSTLANRLAEIIDMDSRAHRPGVKDLAGEMGLTVVALAVEPRSHGNLDARGLLNLAVYILMLAWVAGGGAVLGMWLTPVQVARVRRFLPVFLLPPVFVLVCLAAVAPPPPFGAFVVRLLPLLVGLAATAGSYWYVRVHAGLRQRNHVSRFATTSS